MDREPDGSKNGSENLYAGRDLRVHLRSFSASRIPPAFAGGSRSSVSMCPALQGTPSLKTSPFDCWSLWLQETSQTNILLLIISNYEV